MRAVIETPRRSPKVATTPCRQEEDWQSYVRKGHKVFLFVRDEQEYLELRETADRLFPKASIIIIISQENIVTGTKLHGRVLIRVS